MALTKISTDGVKDDAVTAGKIPANAVGSSELADNAVDTAAIADDAVTTAKIANNAVTADKLPNSGITFAKITDVPQNRIAGRISSGSGVLQELSAANVRSIINVADGATNSTSTTINGNTDNQVITATGTANTLQGEANLTWDATTLKVQAATPAIEISGTNSNGGNSSLHFNANANHWVLEADNYTQQNAFSIKSGTTASSTSRFAIDSNGHARFGPSGDGGDAGWNHSAYGNTEVAIDSPTGYAVLHLRGEGSGSTATRFAIGVGDDKHYLSYDDVDSRHNIVVQGNGVVSIPQGIELGSGTDGTTANTLDDYEYGTYTPAISGTGGWSASHSTQVGSYTKIGDMCFAHIYIVTSSMGGISGSSYLRVSLPFASRNTTSNVGTLACSEWSVGTQNISWLGGRVNNGEQYARFDYHNGNNNNTNIPTKGSFNSQLSFRGTVTYQTA